MPEMKHFFMYGDSGPHAAPSRYVLATFTLEILIPVCQTHTHTHVCKHTYTHKCTHTTPHTHTHTRTHTHAHTHTHTHTHITQLSSLQKDPAVADKAAQWTARLLPFSTLLSHTEHSHINHMLLTLLAELPCDSFLAELVAYCYPVVPTVPDTLPGRFERLMAKLRSHCEAPPTAPPAPGGAPRRTYGSSGEPLSVRYHIHTQRVLAKRHQFGVALTFESLHIAPEGKRGATIVEAPPLKEESPSSLSASPSHMSAPVKTGGPLSEDLPTAFGSFLFEHDREYLRFMDTFFELILSGDAHSALEYPPCGLGISPQGQGVELEQPPFLGLYWNTMGSGGSVGGPCWVQVVPLISLVHEWTQAQSRDIGDAGPARRPGGAVGRGVKAGRAPPSRVAGGKQARRRSLPRASTSLLVTVPVAQLVHALQLEEERRGVAREEPSKRGSLERVTSQDQGCQEEEREKYLQTLQSLEVENIVADGEGGGQDGGIGEQDDVIVSSDVNDAPSSAHTSTVSSEDQRIADAPQSVLLPLAVPAEPVAVLECGIVERGTVGETASHSGRGLTHALPFPLLQIPPEIQKVVVIRNMVPVGLSLFPFPFPLLPCLPPCSLPPPPPPPPVPCLPRLLCILYALGQCQDRLLLRTEMELL